MGCSWDVEGGVLEALGEVFLPVAYARCHETAVDIVKWL